MATPSDPLPVVRAYLAADADLDTASDGRIYIGGVPTAQVKQMPRCCIILSDAGGNLAAGQDPEERIRVQCRVYHETMYEARNTAFQVRARLRALNGYKYSGSAILTAAPSGGPNTRVEPDTHWPVSISTYVIMYPEIT